MKVKSKQSQVICREHTHCPYENCKHSSWHQEKDSCKSRKYQKLRQMVRCTKNIREEQL